MNKFESKHASKLETTETSKVVEIPKAKKPDKVMPRTKDEIVRKFNIFPTLLEQPQKRVVINAALEVLTDKEDSFNHEDIAFTEKFLSTFAGNEKREESWSEKRKQFELATDTELSKKVQAILEFDNPDSLIKDQREVLDIKNHENEHPFVIKVLDVPGVEKFGKSDNDKKWRDFTNCPTLFMYQADKKNSGEASAIFLSGDAAKILLDDPEIYEDSVSPNMMKITMENRKNNILRILKHEYRHTQRDFAVGEERFFYMFDEALNDIEGYNSEKALLQLLTWTSQDISMEKLQDSYNKGDQNEMANVIGVLKKEFGPLGLLKLGDKGTLIQSDVLANSEILDKRASGEDNAQFLEKMLAERRKVDNNFLEIFRQQIKTASRKKLEVYLNHWWLPYLNKKELEKNPNINQLVDIVNEEIIRRKINGEEGFYDAKAEQPADVTRMKEASKKDEEYRKNLLTRKIK